VPINAGQLQRERLAAGREAERDNQEERSPTHFPLRTLRGGMPKENTKKENTKSADGQRARGSSNSGRRMDNPG
jgi:hypothetical protein